MAPQGGRWQRRIQAAESATRLLDELAVDQSKQIDVFGICEDLGLWLAFLPMDNLLGAFVPEGAGGVLVTTQRPIPVQRYTAAHEIAHWRLDHGHGLALDGEEHILGDTPVEREQLAQVFAGNFLMPPPLVFGVLERLGLDGGEIIEAEHAYALAREAGVSYEAAVRQLAHLEVITPDHIAVLRQSRPLQVKAALALGRRPVNGYADVWPVNEAWDDQVLDLRIEDEVVISLPENRSTGYRWMLPDEHRAVEVSTPPPRVHDLDRASVDQGAIANLRSRFAEQTKPGSSARAPGAVLDRLRRVAAATERENPSIHGADVVGDEYVPARSAWLPPRDARRSRLAGRPSESVGASPVPATGDDPIIAGTGRRVIGVRFPQPGPFTIRLQYESPYNDDEPIERYVLHALVEPRRVGFSVDQLANDADEPWTAQVRQRSLEQPLEPLDDGDQLDADAAPDEPD